MIKKVIYVKLLDEGSVAYRPVESIEISHNCFKINCNEIYDPEDEHWEFLPNSIVEVEEKVTDEGEEFLVATRIKK